MNKLLISLATVACIISAVSCGSGSGKVREDFVIASNAQRGQESPQYNSERRVRVRLYAPDANVKSIKLDIDAKLYDLKRNRYGFWAGESDPLDEGFHYYQLVVDGVNVPDPGSEYYYGSARWGSGVDIPSPDSELFEVQKVPQGQLRGTYYWSEEKQAMRHCFVYTPAEYDRNPDKHYPVLYLLPGGAENEYSWARQGRIAQIMDNLLAAGKCEPFLIVMDNCQLEDPWGWEEDYTSIMANDLIPMVDTTFRTISDRDHRAMAGLSYGGLQVKWSAFARPDIISYVGLFSGGTITAEEAAENPAFKDGMKLVFISFGETELVWPTFGIEEGTDPVQQTEDLKASGMNAHFYLSPRTHHEWLSWRRSMYEFAQMLFR